MNIHVAGSVEGYHELLATQQPQNQAQAPSQQEVLAECPTALGRQLCSLFSSCHSLAQTRVATVSLLRSAVGRRVWTLAE